MDTSPVFFARRRRVLALAIALALTFSAAPVAAAQRPVRITVMGRAMSLRGEPTVADALEIAAVQPRVGVMRAAASGSPIQGYVARPVVRRDGAVVSFGARLRDGDRLTVRNGVDWAEPTVVRRVVKTSTPLPAVETQLWHAAHDGLVEQVAGEYSGEVVKETVIDPPAPAAPAAGREVVLTFDDGPDPRWTPIVLDILRDKGVKAVFCMVGSQMRRYPDLVRRAFAEGHVLCNHTEHHDVHLGTRPEAQIRAQIDSVTQRMVELTGQRPRFYRAPGGNLTPFIVDYAHAQGMRVLGWSVDPADYRKPGAAMILQRVAAAIQPAGVTLLHDAGGDRSQTVAQLPALIDRLRADAYAVSVP